MNHLLTPEFTDILSFEPVDIRFRFIFNKYNSFCF